MDNKSTQPRSPRPRTWRSPGGAARDPRSIRRRKRIFFLFVLLVAGALLVALLIIIGHRSEPRFISMPITQYPRGGLRKVGYPRNAFSDQDNAMFGQTFSTKFNLWFNNQATTGRLELQLQDLPRKEDVILYLSGHAVVDHGTVSIVPADGKLGDWGNGLAFRRLLEDIEAHRGKNSKTLLILDIMKPWADPRLGVLADDVGTKVFEILNKRALVFPVLVACSEAQCSHVSRELNGSVFAYYLTQGLAGGALPFEGPGKRTVSVQALGRFVRARVARWVARNRNCFQTPVRFGGPEMDFDLGPPRDGQLEAVSKSAYPAELQKRWTTLQAEDGRYRFRPRDFRALANLLLQAEQRWRSGIDESEIKTELGQDYDLEALTRKLPERPTVGTSTAADLVKELAARFRSLDRFRTQFKDSKDKADPAFLEAQKKLTGEENEFIEKSVAAKTPEQVRFAIRQVGSQDDTPAVKKMELVRRMLEKKNDRYGFVEKVADALAADEAHWAAVVHQAFAAEKGVIDSGEPDEQIVKWVRKTKESADARRQEGMVLVEKHEPDTASRASQLLKEAAQLYQELIKKSDLLREAYTLRALALMRLPGYVPFIEAKLRYDPQTAREWETTQETAKRLREQFTSAVKAARRLADLLEKPAEEIQVPPGLQRAASELRQALEGLELARPGAKELATKAGNGGKGYFELEALLDDFSLSFAKRQQAWDSLCQTAHKLDDDVRLQDDSKDDKEKKATPEPQSTFVMREVIYERARLRTELAIELLRLDGLARQAAAIEETLRTVRNDWSGIGGDVLRAFEDRDVLEDEPLGPPR